MNRSKKTIPFGLLVMSLAMWCLTTRAGTREEIEIAALVDYRDTNEQISIDGKKASFRVGGAGLKLQFNHASLGSIYTSRGIGYSPKESASFLGANLSGPADSTFYGGGYEYSYLITANSKLVLSIDYVKHAIESSVSGYRADQAVFADIDSDITVTDTILAWKYTLTENLSVSAGLGAIKWKVEADAIGTLGDSIRASTDVSANGTDSAQKLKIEYTGFSLPISAQYQRSLLKADNSATLQAFTFELSYPL
ncbi:MAG: hypothetical protein ACN4EJ_07195 [Porticoccaceae bacterium]